jgi:magnesium transporter
MPHRSPLIPLIQRFFEHDPVAAARSLETMKESDVVKVLRALPPNLTAEIFRFFSAGHAAELIKDMAPEIFREIIDKLEPRQGASLFMNLSPEDRERFINELPPQTKPIIVDFLQYPENSAGRIMSTDFLAFHTGVKVKDAIRRIRFLARRNVTASYVYVVDSEDRLVGVINMRDMVISSSAQTLESIMHVDVMAINAFTDREEVANILSKLRYFAAPVIDAERHMLGIVKADQLISDVQAEATEDIQKMFGAGGDERSMSPVLFSLQKRLPWLYVNLATAFLAASVVGLFQDIIARFTVLAVFLPVVAGQGGNAGAQSLAVIMRGLVMREIPRSKVWALIIKETWVGLLNGVTVGIVTALIAWVWHGNPMLGVVIGLAMVVNLLAAGFSGAAIPIGMKAVGLDPAQSSSIVLTTITDVVGFFSFLGFAVLFQNYLG